MRAAVVGEDLTIGLRRVPKPACGPSDVRVAVEACGLCGSDLHAQRRRSWPPGLIPGHEIAGRIEAIGAKAQVEARARGLTVGDRVVVEPLRTCGRCAACAAGQDSVCPDLAITGVHRPGGFAEFVVAEPHRVYRLDGEWPASVATLVEPLAVALHAIARAALVEGERVLVIGGGTLGLLCAFAAHRTGAQVTLRARHPHQAALALALGAVRTEDARPPDARSEAVQEVAGEYAVVFETVGGRGDTLGDACRAAAPRGRVVVLGLLDRDPRFEPMVALAKELSLLWSNCYQTGVAGDPDFAHAIRLLSSHLALLAPLVSDELDLAQIDRAFARAADKHEGVTKLVVVASALSRPPRGSGE